MTTWDKSTPISELGDITPDEASEIFATKYDPSVNMMLGLLRVGCNLSDAERDMLLLEAKSAMEKVVDLPEGLTVEQSRPYVEMADLTYLGMLAHTLATRIPGAMAQAGEGEG
jgi:hypothetical protein